MPTDTFPIATGDDDATGRISEPVWPVTSGGTFTNDPFGTAIVTTAKVNAGGTRRVINAFLRFDTSSIPDTATIDSANLKLYLEDKANPDSVTFAADFYDFGGAPSTVADWELSSAGGAIASILPGALTIGVVNTIALTGLAGISATGFTGLRIAPADPVADPTGDNFCDFCAFEGANQEPRLEVTYTLAGVSNEAALRTAHTPVTWRT